MCSQLASNKGWLRQLLPKITAHDVIRLDYLVQGYLEGVERTPKRVDDGLV